LNGTAARFVICFQGRTGSTFLVEALDAHPDVRCEYELMSSNRGVATPEEQVARARQFLMTSDDHRAVGFKTKLNDVLDPTLFARMLQSVDAGIVLLRRRNVVKQVVSWCNAERVFKRTGDWNLYAGDAMVAQPIEIGIATFNDRLNEIVRSEERLSRYVESLSCPRLDIYYEQLLTDRDAVLARIFDFVGVEPTTSRGRTIKSTADDLRVVLANFAELRAAYADTEFAGMFDEVRVTT
jgi:LPS sulfotransferase NodH